MKKVKIGEVWIREIDTNENSCFCCLICEVNKIYIKHREYFYKDGLFIFLGNFDYPFDFFVEKFEYSKELTNEMAIWEII